MPSLLKKFERHGNIMASSIADKSIPAFGLHWMAPLYLQR